MLIAGCSTSQKIVRDLQQPDTHPYFSGIKVYDPVAQKTLIEYNSEKYFTPASTVKLFTLYAALETLGDSIATFALAESKDTLYLKPLADPSFLHDSLPNTTFDFLQNETRTLCVVRDFFPDFVYGDGWQWDDYPYYYMPEKSLLPLYGNVALLQGKHLTPSSFQKNLKTTYRKDFHRDFYQNNFYYNPDKLSKRRKIPFRTSLELSVELLSDTLHKPVFLANSFVDKNFKTKYSTPTLPLYERLMDESENFMAEQLFLILAKQKTDSYEVKNAIDWSMENLFSDIPQSPRWVDASGLSRYNLFAPDEMVYLLEKLLLKQGKEKVKELLPNNGEEGALQKWYPYETTYLYAKTGSVSNNHSLCGYMETKKGNFLIFSYMNNNYQIPSSELRKEMNRVLQDIYNTY